MEQETQTEQTQTENWMDTEIKDINEQSAFDGEKLPSLQFEENTVVKFTIDFTTKFAEWVDPVNKNVKAIIPVMHKEEKKNLWLNKKNPLYGELIKAGKEGQTEFSVSQTGNQANTKYNLVKEE